MNIMIIEDSKETTKALFGDNVSLLPGVDEVFELELAYLEYKALKEDVLERSAYIKSIGDQYSSHYLAYSPTHDDNQEELFNDDPSGFATAYATHGLFPYRGKFHPQMIKALLNICGVKPGDYVLDPMAGSGTTNIEASLAGINSYAIDVSPFCQFMIYTKYLALTIEPPFLDLLETKSSELFHFYHKNNVFERLSEIHDDEKIKAYYLGFLAYLDALGYSKRVSTSNHEQLFAKVLSKYLNYVKLFIANRTYNPQLFGDITVLKESDATRILLPDNSIDCVITSPPYSFAIDYAENDRSQLELMGIDPNGLKEKLIGLKGKTKQKKLDNYFIDIDRVCNEVSRVLKVDKCFVVIIGSNTNQTGGIRLERKTIELAEKHGLFIERIIKKPIKGMRNIMKNEYILIFRKRITK